MRSMFCTSPSKWKMPYCSPAACCDRVLMISNSCVASTFLQRIVDNVLTLSVYRHRNLIVQADVQQLKNSVNVDIRRDAAIEFKLGDPIIVHMVRQIVWESVTVNNDHQPRAGYGLSSSSTTRTFRNRKCFVSYIESRQFKQGSQSTIANPSRPP